MNQDLSPFTYLIGWSKANLFYYGVRYAQKASPTTLWVTYFTSSKEVKKQRSLLGEPDIIQIRKIFRSEVEARSWEHRVLRRMKVIQREDFLNKTTSTGRDFGRKLGDKGHPHSEAHKQKMRKLMKGRIFSEETKLKMSIAAAGRKASKETKLKMGKSQSGRTHSEETKAKMRAYHASKRI